MWEQIFFSCLKGNLLSIQYNIYREIYRKDYMSKIRFYLDKYKIYFFISITCLLLLGILFFLLFYNKEEVIAEEIIREEKKEEVKEEIKTIKVDIKGRVKNQGVYEMNEDSRIIDVINKAGGLKENANT